MKKRASDIIIFCLSVIAFIISFVLLSTYGAYEVSYGGGTVIVDGGWFLIIMNLLRMAVLLAACIVSGMKLFSSKKWYNSLRKAIGILLYIWAVQFLNCTAYLFKEICPPLYMISCCTYRKCVIRMWYQWFKLTLNLIPHL